MISWYQLRMLKVSFRILTVIISLSVSFFTSSNRELYIHRIGRSGRFGRKGVSINFVKTDDIRILRDIEQYYSTQVRHCIETLEGVGRYFI